MTELRGAPPEAPAGKGERLREALIKMIKALPQGAALPTERELCEQFDVARGTVRQVLQRLEIEQRIYRRQGKGTFVAPAKIEQRLGLTSHTEEMRASGFEPSSKLTDVSRLVAPPDIRSALALPEGAEVLQIERLRLADGEAIALEVLYLNAERFDGITAALGEDVSFYQLLHVRYGVELDHADETIEAVIAGPREARLLGCAEPAALLQLSRLSIDSRGRPVEYVRSLYRGDRFRFRQELQRPPESVEELPLMRPAMPEDAPQLASVFATTWRAHYRGIVPDDVIDALDEAELAVWLRPLTEGGDRLTTVCQAADGAVLGFVSYGADPTAPRDGHIFSLYVHGDHAGHGYGRRLLRRALADLARRGHSAVTLWVFEANDVARGLYTSEGFRPDGAQQVEPEYRVNELRLRREAPQR